VWARDARGWKIVGDYAFGYGRLPRAKSSPITLPPATLDVYAGMYAAPERGIAFTVLRQGGDLHVRWAGAGPESDAVRLTTIDDTTFVDPDGLEFTFVRNPAGAVKEVIAISDGPAWRASRQP
jgi:hypothetical protein